jgi:uncharacterized OB-fold protein
MTGSSLPRPVPVISPETEPFWSATLDDRLRLTKCDACGQVIWYPRPFCPQCGASCTSWIDAEGSGSIYAYTVIRSGDGEYRGLTYVLAYVELPEGPRLLTNIVSADIEDLYVGMPVEVVFERTDGPAALPRFRPVS